MNVNNVKILEKIKFQSTCAIIKDSIENGILYKKTLGNKTTEYPNDFLSKNEIIETVTTLDYNLFSGFAKRLVFNGIRIEHRNFNLLSPLEAEVSLNFPYFKMQFCLDGYYSYKASNSKSLDVCVTKGQHQLFYFPEVKEGIVNLGSKSTNSKSLEITLSLNFIYRVFKNSWEVLDLLGGAIKKDIPLVYGTNSQVISKEMHSVIKQIQNCKVKKELQKAYLEAKVIELLVLQINDLSGAHDITHDTSQIKHIAKIKEAKAFIETNIDSELTIPCIAKRVGLNVNYLKAEFKELYNETIFQHLTNLRMEHAKHLIVYSDCSIAEIANKVGYKYAQHFTKAFKKFSGITPSLLRKEQQVF